ncbi:hypothetical protein C173_10006 [Paenibacillus sp. FSL R7-277]|uniref:CD-NTase-associated endodeoxyribonuclease Cap4 n=1 Tax=Paenibacillus sp. FSL R7-277 TaxID=1227352 RepID=UPI0003E2A05F|nr:SAVED domain-containing protein [Paenibacillus sp. FSL R7-277]ETT74125.1 hypothetical protein C173_10006 [Paenibacillus sp. FSL R7-277]
MTDNNRLKPSLLEPQSQGGDTAESGFDFQTNMILCKIPLWLSMEGFDSLIREATADFEAKIFSPSEGIYREAVEAKNHHMAPSEFWAEIDRFMELHEGIPGTYKHFTICCNGISDEIKPLIIGLRRVRDPQSFYDADSALMINSFDDYLRRVERLGKDRKVANFLYENVLIEPLWNLNSDESTSKGILTGQLNTHMPQYQDLTGREISEIYKALLDLLKANKARPITRRQIEETIQNATGGKIQSLKDSVVISTEIEELSKREKYLQFKWADFFGGANRSYPTPDKWNDTVMSQLRETAGWIRENRGSRCILLKGNRRLSTSVAIGSVFSAVAGFNVVMDYRGELWSTQDHPDFQTPDYSFERNYEAGTGDNLVLTVGIMKDNLASEVAQFKKLQGVSPPRLHLCSSHPITSAKQANLAVNEIKKEIVAAVLESKSKQIDFFYAGPAHLALFFGHRINSLPPIQCYEWVGANSYVATCLI